MFFKEQRLRFITLVYWFLLIYIVAALVWWFISLEKQNQQMYGYNIEQLKKEDSLFSRKLYEIEDLRKRKQAQYIGEGATFLCLILVGAVFVYRATKKQIRLSRQQQNFMMAVTHELKTPIAITRLNLETLQKHKLDETKQQKLLAVALQETDRLNTLTNNILVAAQLESGQYALNKQEINFAELVRHCVKYFHHRFPDRIIEENVIDGVYVTGEAMLLQMLVNNLMDNAIKYSGKEAVVTVSLTQSNNKAVLKIADEGEGISDTEKKKIFEKFYRVGNEATRTTKGTGLGLYLCKRIVYDHNGSITVAPNTPKGTVFIVSLETYKS